MARLSGLLLVIKTKYGFKLPCFVAKQPNMREFSDGKSGDRRVGAFGVELVFALLNCTIQHAIVFQWINFRASCNQGANRFFIKV